jgi:hypothetical protein
MTITDQLSMLKEGDLVTFAYRQQSGNGRWYKWTCTAVYIARNTTEYQDQVVVSYRPKAGTSYIDVSGIDQVRVIMPFRERSGHRGDDNVHLPARFPGAVPAPVKA